MSAPVNVLAVLDRLDAKAERHRWAIAVRDDIATVRAAVAELIEAARQVELIDFGRATLGRGAVRKRHAIFQSFRNALARVGGTS